MVGQVTRETMRTLVLTELIRVTTERGVSQGDYMDLRELLGDSLEKALDKMPSLLNTEPLVELDPLDPTMLTLRFVVPGGPLN